MRFPISTDLRSRSRHIDQSPDRVLEKCAPPTHNHRRAPKHTRISLANVTLPTQGASKIITTASGLGSRFNNVSNLQYPAFIAGMRQLNLHTTESPVLLQQPLEFTAVYGKHPT